MLGNCYLCGRYAPLEKHHVFNGANRKRSEKYGATVYLCHQCHNEPPNGVHFNAENMRKLKAEFQRIIMEKYSMDIEDFIQEFGKNYIY